MAEFFDESDIDELLLQPDSQPPKSMIPPASTASVAAAVSNTVARKAPEEQTFPSMMLSQDEDLLLLGSSGHGRDSLGPSTGAVSPVSSNFSGGAAYVSGGTNIRNLPWCAGSRAREGIKTYFEDQFQFELYHNEQLRGAFEPFTSSKLGSVRRRSLSILHPANMNVPPVAHGALRSYQQEGVQFLLKSFAAGKSCILADDMGLGKTAQVASFLHALDANFGVTGPHLIIVPFSSLGGWTRELHQWAPGLRVVKYHGDKRSRASAIGSGADRFCVYLTTSATAVSELKFFKSRQWVTAIVDEAHILKNSSTSINKLAARLNCAFRIAVTGTPVQNTPQEVSNIMKFLYPNFCRKNDIFDEEDADAVLQCKTLLEHIMIRRTKDGIELGLPPRIDEPIQMVEPTPLQQQLLALISSNAENCNEFSSLQGLFMQVRKVCNHPQLVPLLERKADCGFDAQHTALDRLKSAGVALTEESIIHSSAKMMKLDLMLKEMHGKHRVLIFSNFTSQLDVLEGFCHLRGYSFDRLDGSCTRVERELAMRRFNDPMSTVFLFLVTTTAGGVGVTLTGADTVILYDAHYNPQIDRQAADRAHRIGQTRPVHIYRLCLQGSAEEGVLQIARSKAAIGDMIVDGKTSSSEMKTVNLSYEDMRQIMKNQSDAKDKSAELTDFETVILNNVFRSLDTLYEKKEALVNNRGRQRPTETHICFCCNEKMRPLEPLLHCSVCPKAYHPDCIHTNPTEVRKSNWACPRHACHDCEKKVTGDGALFLCQSCPTSFCFDCLDDRYLELELVTGITSFKHLSRSYAAMESEGVHASRAVYYVTCLQCLGMDTDSSEDEDEDVDDDEEGNSESETALYQLIDDE